MAEGGSRANPRMEMSPTIVNKHPFPSSLCPNLGAPAPPGTTGGFRIITMNGEENMHALKSIEA